jgi:hypothetical protein
MLTRSVAPKYLKRLDALGPQVGIPNHKYLAHRFLAQQLDPDTFDDIPLQDCPLITSYISVFHSITALYFSPSNPAGIDEIHS